MYVFILNNKINYIYSFHFEMFEFSPKKRPIV